MIDEPKIVKTTLERAAIIRIRVARSRIREVMGPAMQEVREVVGRQGLKVTGPMFAHHFGLPANEFHFEVGLPVASDVTPEGRVVPGELPEWDAAYTVHHGGYEGLAAAWQELEVWMRQNRHSAAVEFVEKYASGPAEDPDPSTWCTELIRQLY